MDYQDMQTEEKMMLQPEDPETSPKQPPNNMATASLVLGILSLVTFCCYYLVLPLGGLSILFGLLSRPEGKFSGHAKAGMIMAVIAIVLMIVFWVAIVVAVIMTDGDSSIQNMPMVPPIPDMTHGLDNLLTVVLNLPAGGVR